MSALAALRRIPLPMHSRLPGIIVAALLGLAALWMAGGLGEPLARNPVLVAMLFGLFVGNVLHCPEALRPGLDFTKRYLLRAAVVLVGFRITGGLLIDLGAVPLAVAAAELVLVLVLLRWIARRMFKLDAELALLVAVGSAVCGAADPVGGRIDARQGGAYRHRHCADHLERYAGVAAVSGGLSGRLATRAGRALLRHLRWLQYL